MVLGTLAVPSHVSPSGGEDPFSKMQAFLLSAQWAVPEELGENWYLVVFVG